MGVMKLTRPYKKLVRRSIKWSARVVNKSIVVGEDDSPHGIVEYYREALVPFTGNYDERAMRASLQNKLATVIITRIWNAGNNTLRLQYLETEG